jgi:hypothetical protein
MKSIPVVNIIWEFLCGCNSIHNVNNFRAVRIRKVLGGGMRQAGILASAASVSLDLAQTTITADHKHAKMLAEGECIISQLI